MASPSKGPWFFLGANHAPRLHTFAYLHQVESVTRLESDHNHPVSSTPHPIMENTGNSAPSTLEEPEYLARYMVVKHSCRGRYKRILCISSVAIITLDPLTLAVMNSYDVANDFEGASPILGRHENSNEFSISVRTNECGKFKAMKFSSNELLFLPHFKFMIKNKRKTIEISSPSSTPLILPIAPGSRL